MNKQGLKCIFGVDFVDSVGGPVLLQQPYDARIMNPACLKTGGKRKLRKSRRSKKNNRERKDEIDDIYISTKGLARELNLPIWSVSQVNRAGAKDDIIEGDKAAGSYDKMMVTDVAISLSRKRQDKVNGTGRFHIMKNRYGMDGLTFAVKADTSTGHFEVSSQIDDDDESSTPASQNNGFGTIDSIDKALMRNKFFELQTD